MDSASVGTACGGVNLEISNEGKDSLSQFWIKASFRNIRTGETLGDDIEEAISYQKPLAPGQMRNCRTLCLRDALSVRASDLEVGLFVTEHRFGEWVKAATVRPGKPVKEAWWPVVLRQLR